MIFSVYTCANFPAGSNAMKLKFHVRDGGFLVSPLSLAVIGFVVIAMTIIEQHEHAE